MWRGMFWGCYLSGFDLRCQLCYIRAEKIFPRSVGWPSASTDLDHCCKAWAGECSSSFCFPSFDKALCVLYWPRWAGYHVPHVHLGLFSTAWTLATEEDQSWDRHSRPVQFFGKIYFKYRGGRQNENYLSSTGSMAGLCSVQELLLSVSYRWQGLRHLTQLLLIIFPGY